MATDGHEQAGSSGREDPGRGGSSERGAARPVVTGVEFLARAGRLFPTSKRAVLVEWGDRTAQEPVLRAMTLGHIDYYANKPERPGDEHFHKLVAEFLYDWAKAHNRPVFAEMRVVGERWSARSHELRDVLSRNGILHEFYAAESEAGQELLFRLRKRPPRPSGAGSHAR